MKHCLVAAGRSPLLCPGGRPGRFRHRPAAGGLKHRPVGAGRPPLLCPGGRPGRFRHRRAAGGLKHRPAHVVFFVSLRVFLVVCSLFSSGAEARNAAAFPGASAPFVLGGCKAGPAGGAGILREPPHPRRAAYRLPCGQPRTPLRRSRCQNWLAGLPGRLLCGSPLTPPRRLPCGQPRTPLRCSRCQNWPDGPDGTSCHAGIPAPSPAAHVAFFFIGPGGVCLATYLPG